MGGVVSYCMKLRGDFSMEEHGIISEYRQYGPQSKPVPNTGTDHSSEIYEFLAVGDPRPQEEVQKDLSTRMNWVKVLQEKAEKIPSSNALAYRDLEKVENKVSMVNGKERVAQIYHLSTRRNLTYKQMWTLMTHFAIGLRSLHIPARSKVCLYEETRWEWLVSIYGIWLQNGIAATVYANLGEDALQFSLQESEAVAIITNGKQVPALLKILHLIGLSPIIIYLDALPADLDTTASSFPFRLYTWDAVIARGKKALAMKGNPSSRVIVEEMGNESHPEDESTSLVGEEAGDTTDTTLFIPEDNEADALIMYTSGTTGNPKGVVHTHRSLTAGFHILNQRFSDLYPKSSKKSYYCAYLPLAHILEFAIVNLTLYNEMMVGFGSARTLTDNFAVPHGDIKEYMPNFLIGVPRVYDSIKKAIEAKLPPPGSIKREVFDTGYEERKNALLEGVETPYWNNAVFSAARDVLGENMLGMLSGGGPLSSSTQEFINVVCGGPLIIQGWGLTESVCCGATQRLGDLNDFVVGQPVIAENIKLEDTEDYKHTDQPEPRGELCIRGPFLFKGYYKQPELTKEAIDDEGWFHTGDIGSITEGGRFRVVGRIKGLAKNSLGEYIAMETLEALYGQHPLCAVNGVCVVVHPNRNYIAALVLTEPHRATAFAKENKLEPTSYPEVLNNPEFHACVAASFQKLAKQGMRMNFEMVKVVRVLPDEWTPENELLTPTSKLRRSKIEEHYAPLIKELFKQE